MKSPVDFDSRPAKHLSGKIRGLARKVNASQYQEQRDERKRSDSDEYKLVHTPDRPQQRIDPSQIPSEEECKIYLQQLHRAKRETRRSDNTGVDVGRTPSTRSNFIEHNRGESRFNEVPYSEKYTNPRAAPKPFPARCEQDERHSLPLAARAAIPPRPESALSVPRPAKEAAVHPQSQGSNSLGSSTQVPTRRGNDSHETRPRTGSTPSNIARPGPRHQPPTPAHMEPNRSRGPSAIDPGRRRCRMPNCHSLAVRSTRGLCDACEADFVIRPSVFYEDPATLVRRECPELAAFDNDAAPPLPTPRRTAREVVETGHLAHEMRIVAPAESPREICVGSGTSPIPIPSRRGPLPLRREEWDEREVRRRLLEVPAKNKASSTAPFPEEREEEVGGGSRSETVTAAADPTELRRRQHDNRSLRKQKSVVATSSGGIDTVRPKSSSSSPIAGWPGSEYYFDDSNFPSKMAARKDAVETIKEEEGKEKEKEKAGEEEDGMSACCRDVKDKCESEVSRSLHLRELYKELRSETSSEDEKGGEDLPSSPILSTFHVDSWSGDSLYADLPDLETECSTSPMTLIFGIPTRMRH